MSLVSQNGQYSYSIENEGVRLSVIYVGSYFLYAKNTHPIMKTITNFHNIRRIKNENN